MGLLRIENVGPGVETPEQDYAGIPWKILERFAA